MTPPPGCRLFTVLVYKPALLLRGPTNVGCTLIYSQWGRKVLEGRETLDQLDTDVPCPSLGHITQVIFSPFLFELLTLGL